jgi:tetratricopeptide (TPR) repeat protein
MRVTQLILDGDEHFTAGRYNEARTNFQMALHEARTSPDLYDMLDSKALEARIELSDDHIYINSLISLGDLQADLGQYFDALANFNEARNLAISVGYRAIINDIRLRISEVTSRATAAQENQERRRTESEQIAHDDNIQRIERNVLAGDTAAAAGDFDQARRMYEQAVRDFLAAGEVVRASEIQNRIADMDSRQRNLEREDIIRAIELAVLEGERAMAERDYARAAAIFEQAAWDFIVAGETGRASALQYRIIDVNSRQRNNEQDRINREAEGLIREIELSIVEGDAALARGDYDMAIRIFEQAARDFIEISNVSQATAMRRRIMDAESARDRALRNEVIGGIELTVQSAEVAEAAGDYDRAILLYQMAVDSFISAREPARATELRLRIIEIEARHTRRTSEDRLGEVEAAVIEGDLAAARGDFDNAIRILQQAARDFTALGETARATAVRTRISELEESRREVVQDADAEDARSIVIRAEAAFARGDYVEAIRLFNQARTQFLALGMANDVRVMDNRISDANEGVADGDRDRQILAAENIEREGDRLLAAGEFDRAREQFRQAQVAFQRLGETERVAALQEKIRIADEREEAARQRADEAELARLTLIAQSIEHEGDRYLAAENFDRARELYRQAMLEFQRLGLPNRANAVQEKIRIANELEEAIRQGAADAELARQILAIQAIEHEGDHYLAMGNFDRARELYREALLAYQRLGLNDRASAVQDKIRIADETEEAIRQGERDAELATQISEARNLEQRGDFYLARRNPGDFDLARERFRQAQEIYLRLGMVDEVTVLQNKIRMAYDLEASSGRENLEFLADEAMAQGDQHMFFEDYDLALERFRYARDIFIQLRDFISADDARQKIETAEEAIRIRQIRNDATEAMVRGDQFIDDGRYYLALEQFIRARNLFYQIGNPRYLDAITEITRIEYRITQTRIRAAQALSDGNAFMAANPREYLRARLAFETAREDFRRVGDSRVRDADDGWRNAEAARIRTVNDALEEMRRGNELMTAGYFMLARDRFSEAERLFRLVLPDTRYADAGRRIEEAQAGINAMQALADGDVHMASGNFQLAFEAFERAMDFFYEVPSAGDRQTDAHNWMEHAGVGVNAIQALARGNYYLTASIANNYQLAYAQFLIAYTSFREVNDPLSRYNDADTGRIQAEFGMIS